MIFGRAGEEIEVLQKERIGFDVVPGINAAAYGRGRGLFEIIRRGSPIDFSGRLNIKHFRAQ